MQASFRLGQIAGITIGVHYTWLLAFALVAWSLAVGAFPQMFPGWSELAYWATGVLGALLLFGSVLVHELAHSFVAMARGLGVHSITLFIFGGVSNITGEARSARDEFAIAAVGPVTSLLLGALFGAALFVVVGLRGALEGPLLEMLRDLGPLGAILWYLALINVLLGLFNLLPGFPLDGGRVLRSILWGATRSFARATNIAATVGQVFAWLLIAFGLYRILQGEFLAGVWTAFIGWFLSGAAEASRRDVATREQFRGVTVGQVMDQDVETVMPGMAVEDLVRDIFLRHGRRAAPVVTDGRLWGIVTFNDVKELPQDQWAHTPVTRIMTRPPLHEVSVDTDLAEALRLLAENNINQVLVIESGRLVGLLNRADVIRYFQMMDELGLRRGWRG